MQPEQPEQPERASWFRRHRTALVSAVGGFLLVGVAAVLAFVVWASPPNASAAASPTPQPTATPSPTAQPTTTPQPTPTPNPFDSSLLAHRYTVLVIGEDSNATRRLRGSDSRTDAMMVVSLSPHQKRITLLSIPRDVVDVPLSNGLTFTSKINGIAQAYGYDGLVGAIGTMLEIRINAYAKLDMDNFVQLVDAVGGVKVTNPGWLIDAHLDLSLAPGRARLDGATALKYVRSRYTSSDFARAARQQQVVLALARKYANPDVDLDLPTLLGTLTSLQTDVDLADLPTLLEMVRRARGAEVTRMVLAPPRFALGWGDQGDGRGWVIIPNVAEMRAYAASVMGD